MMGQNKIGRYTISGLKKALMLGAGVGVLASAALAQVEDQDVPLKLQTDYLGYAAGVSTRFTYSDNINLLPSGFKDGEFITSVALSGGAIISSPRVTGLILGDLDFSYLTDRGDLAINQDIGATSTFTAADNWLYVDISGSTSRQLIGDNARFSGNINGARGQRANVHSYIASPYIYHRMADQSAVELRYRWSQVFVDDAETDFNPSSGSFLNDSRSHEAIASYESGGLFDRLRFKATAYGNKTIDDGSDFFPEPIEYQQGSLFGEAELAMSRSFSVSGAVGYDDVQTSDAASLFFNDEELSGVFWRAGFTTKPGRRSRIRLEYGRRYGDDFIDADVFYELSQRFVFSAGASRTFQTRAAAVNSQFRSIQRQTLDFADRLREGEELSPRGIIDASNRFARSVSGGSAQTIGLGTTNSAYAALTGAYDRTEVTASTFYSDTDFGFRQTEVYGASLNGRRRVSRRLIGYGNVTYRHVDTMLDSAVCLANPAFVGVDPMDVSAPALTAIECAQLAVEDGVTNTVVGSIGASYRLYENVSAYAEVSHTERFSENLFQEYNENTAMVGVTLDF